MQGYGYSLKSDPDFQTSQGVVKTKRKIAKQQGLGNRPNRAEAFSPDDEERLWTTGQMGAHNPLALLRALWFLTSKLMGKLFLLLMEDGVQNQIVMINIFVYSLPYRFNQEHVFSLIYLFFTTSSYISL